MVVPLGALRFGDVGDFGREDDPHLARDGEIVGGEGEQAQAIGKIDGVGGRPDLGRMLGDGDVVHGLDLGEKRRAPAVMG